MPKVPEDGYAAEFDPAKRPQRHSRTQAGPLGPKQIAYLREIGSFADLEAASMASRGEPKALVGSNDPSSPSAAGEPNPKEDQS